MTSPLREMTAAARAMARGDYSPPGPGDLARRGRRAGRARSTRWPPTWPRPTGSAASCRQRVARAAHADHRAAGGAGEPRRRRRPGRPGDAARPRWPRPSGSAGWSPSCSTCPGSRPARSPLDADRVRRAGRSSRRRVARGPGDAAGRGRDVASTVGTEPATSVRRRPRAAAPGRREPARQRGPAQPAGRHGHASRAGPRATASALEVTRRGPGHPGRRARTGLRTLHPRCARRRHRRRHRARPGHRPLGRGPARRHDRRGRLPARLPHPRRTSATYEGSVMTDPPESPSLPS